MTIDEIIASWRTVDPIVTAYGSREWRYTMNKLLVQNAIDADYYLKNGVLYLTYNGVDYEQTTV